MINKYLKYLQEEDQQLNEFVVLPILLLVGKLYKKYVSYQKIALNCTTLSGVERKKCLIKYKIIGLEKTKNETLKFINTCKRWSTNVPKCINNVNKQVKKLDKEIGKQKRKLAKL